ncbi:MAG: sigma-70 family RNA polymerase sigma factor [Bacteroidota bacterium]
MLLDLLIVLAFAATPDVDDAALAQAIREGDHRAFRVFFDRYHAALLGYLGRRKVPPAAAEDLVQKAFIYIWTHRADIDPEKSLRAYLFRIAYTRALNHFRDTAKFDRDAELSTLPLTTNVGDAAEQALLQEALDAAIAALPERRRAVFELCFLQELTYKEAAAALEVSVKTVENQMGYAFKALRQALAAFRA